MAIYVPHPTAYTSLLRFPHYAFISFSSQLYHTNTARWVEFLTLPFLSLVVIYLPVVEGREIVVLGWNNAAAISSSVSAERLFRTGLADFDPGS